MENSHKCLKTADKLKKPAAGKSYGRSASCVFKYVQMKDVPTNIHIAGEILSPKER